MAGWPTGVAAVTLFVEDVAVAKEFYERAFGLPAHYTDDVSGPRTAAFSDPDGHVWEIAH